MGALLKTHPTLIQLHFQVGERDLTVNELNKMNHHCPALEELGVRWLAASFPIMPRKLERRFQSERQTILSIIPECKRLKHLLLYMLPIEPEVHRTASRGFNTCFDSPSAAKIAAYCKKSLGG